MSGFSCYSSSSLWNNPKSFYLFCKHSICITFLCCYFTFSCNLLIKHYPAIYSHLPIHPIVPCFFTCPRGRSFYETVGLLRCVSFHSNPLYPLTDFRSFSLTRISTAFQHWFSVVQFSYTYVIYRLV